MTTGSLVRDEFIVRAIKETVACHENPQQIGFVADKLPADFDLSDAELIDALRELKMTDPESLAETATPAAEVGSAPADDRSSPQAAPDNAPQVKLTYEQARIAVEKAHKRLGEARVAVVIARNRHQDTKGALALAIEGWQRNADPMTPEQRRQQEVRNHLASEAAKRQRLADAGLATTRMDTRKFPAQNMQTGAMGHKGNSRGAYPREYQHRTISKPGGE
jgi:hypothetical protein